MGYLHLEPVAEGWGGAFWQANEVSQMVTNSSERPEPGLEQMFPGLSDRYSGRISALRSLVRAAGKPAIDASIIYDGPTAIGMATAVKSPLIDTAAGTVMHEYDGVNVAYWFDWSAEQRHSDLSRIELHREAGQLVVARATVLAEEPYTFGLLSDSPYEPSLGLRHTLPWRSELGDYEAGDDLEAINVSEVPVRLHADSAP